MAEIHRSHGKEVKGKTRRPRMMDCKKALVETNGDYGCCRRLFA